MYIPTKKYLRTKAKKLFVMGQLWLKVTAFWNIDRTLIKYKGALVSRQTWFPNRLG